MSSHFSIIGLMSGTSLDGIDLSFCTYNLNSNKWDYSIHTTKSYPYSKEWQLKLKNAIQLSALELYQLDIEIAHLFSDCIQKFIKEYSIELSSITAISSHGHTVYHQPEKGFTIQIGNGETISALTNLMVINDFRSKDVALGGQGAPLVPIGDHLLFGELADGFLNIGGISNISYINNNSIKAFDICPGNLPLNYLIQKIGLSYDQNGELARKGKIHHELLNELNALEYYTRSAAKSLGIEWFETDFFPLLKKHVISLEEQLATIVEHIALMIGTTANKLTIQQLFITGGGAYNGYLVERIGFYYEGKIIIPEKELIEFKEAIIFGFLGACRLALQPTALSSVTGAIRNSCGGVIHIPN